MSDLDMLPEHPRSPERISYRKHDWLNTKTMEPVFGIQAKAVGFEWRWAHCSEDHKPMFFTTEEERDAKLNELRKRARAFVKVKEMRYTAWIWRSEPAPGVERRENHFNSLASARHALALWIDDWPEATEYGIDHEEEDGPVADFLSDAILERIKEGK